MQRGFAHIRIAQLALCSEVQQWNGANISGKHKKTSPLLVRNKIAAHYRRPEAAGKLSCLHHREVTRLSLHPEDILNTMGGKE